MSAEELKAQVTEEIGKVRAAHAQICSALEVFNTAKDIVSALGAGSSNPHVSEALRGLNGAWTEISSGAWATVFAIGELEDWRDQI